MKLLTRSFPVARSALALALFIGAAAPVLADPPQDMQQAETALNNGDVFTAMALLRKAADQGYGAAQARLGDLLHAAEFDKEAIALYRKAAEQGEAAGEFGLGRMYAHGTGVDRDAAQALEWYRKSEKKDHPPTLEALARAYRTGDLGLARDLDQANALEARAKQLRQNAKGAK